MSELYIPPERFERDLITGRFLKGCVSRNKGRKMVYHSKRSKARSIKNLSKGRGGYAFSQTPLSRLSCAG